MESNEYLAEDVKIFCDHLKRVFHLLPIGEEDYPGKNLLRHEGTCVHRSAFTQNLAKFFGRRLLGRFPPGIYRWCDSSTRRIARFGLLGEVWPLRDELHMGFSYFISKISEIPFYTYPLEDHVVLFLYDSPFSIYIKTTLPL